MREISIMLVPGLTVLLVGLIMPFIASVKYKAEQSASNGRNVCYSRADILAMRICAVILILLTSVTLVCTISSIIYPDMSTSFEDICGITILWILCIMLDVFSITWSIKFTRKIHYNNTSFVEIKPFNKKRKYFYTDITSIKNTAIVRLGRNPDFKGALKIYFGEECVKIPARMFGVSKFINVLRQKCPNIEF